MKECAAYGRGGAYSPAAIAICAAVFAAGALPGWKLYSLHRAAVARFPQPRACSQGIVEIDRAAMADRLSADAFFRRAGSGAGGMPPDLRYAPLDTADPAPAPEPLAFAPQPPSCPADLPEYAPAPPSPPSMAASAPEKSVQKDVPASGFHCSPELSAAGFSFDPPDPSALSGTEGEAEFHVATDRNGMVETALELPHAGVQAEGWRRAIRLGRAKGAVRGKVRVWWKYGRDDTGVLQDNSKQTKQEE